MRRRWRVGLIGAVVLLVALAAVGTWAATRPDAPVAAAPTSYVDELAAHGGAPCPPTLPDPGEERPELATELPHLAEAQQAWSCVYDAVPAGRTAHGGTAYAWERRGPVRELADLAAVRDAVGGLSLLDPDRACSSELGPRRVLVTAHEGDLTGVVVDDFGCREVRLTAEPWTEPPGESTGGGVVTGQLGSSEELRYLLGVTSPAAG